MATWLIGRRAVDDLHVRRQRKIVEVRTTPWLAIGREDFRSAGEHWQPGGRVQATGDAFWHQRDTGNCRRGVLKQAQAAGGEILGALWSISGTNSRGRNWRTHLSLREQIFWASSFKPEEDRKYPWLGVRKPSRARENVRVKETARKVSACVEESSGHRCLWWQLVSRKKYWFSSGKDDVRMSYIRSRKSTLCSGGA